MPLVDVIRQLRGDLYLAGWQGEGKEPKFEVGPIELEFEVVVGGSRSGSVAAQLWVMTANVGANHSSQVTHRIKLTLQPVDAHGRQLKVSGPALDGEESP